MITHLTEWIFGSDGVFEFKRLRVSVGGLCDDTELVLLALLQLGDLGLGPLGSLYCLPATLVHVHLLNTVTTEVSIKQVKQYGNYRSLH